MTKPIICRIEEKSTELSDSRMREVICMALEHDAGMRCGCHGRNDTYLIICPVVHEVPISKEVVHSLFDMGGIPLLRVLTLLNVGEQII